VETRHLQRCGNAWLRLVGQSYREQPAAILVSALQAIEAIEVRGYYGSQRKRLQLTTEMMGK